MSNWNPAVGQAMMTSATDVNTTVAAYASKIKVGSPCDVDKGNTPLTRTIFGLLESVTVEVMWEEHQRFPDEQFQNQTLCRKYCYRF